MLALMIYFFSVHAHTPFKGVVVHPMPLMAGRAVFRADGCQKCLLLRKTIFVESMTNCIGMVPASKAKVANKQCTAVALGWNQIGY